MRTKAIVVLLCFLLVALAVRAQEFWQKKDSAKWSENECKKLLEDSPWGRTYELATVSMRPLSMDADRTDDNIRKAAYHVQIRSAKPVREAMVQRGKLRAKYDSLAPEKKQAMDEQFAKFLAQQFPDAIVVGVEYSATTTTFDRDMATYWQQQNLDLIKNTTYLIVHGQRVQPVQFFVAPGAGREFELVFPRTIDGKPVLSAEDKSFSVEFQYPPLGEQPATSNIRPNRQPTVGAENNYISGGRVLAEFKTKKMTAPTGEFIF